MSSKISKVQTMTTEENARFTELLAIADSNSPAFYAMGTAMLEIRDRKLYRDTYDSWEEFCEKRFDMTRNRANRLIAAAAVESAPESNPELKETNKSVQNCTSLLNKTKSTESGGSIIKTPSQARELAKVPTEDRPAVLAAVSGAGKSVTAKAIRNAAQAIVERTNPPEVKDAVEVDCEGFPIPESTLERWHRRNEIKELMQAISRVKAGVKRAMEAKEWIGNNVNFQSLMTDLGNAYSGLKFCTPYAVCTSCNGVRSAKCSFCSGTGLLSELAWKTAAPQEVKDLRAKGIK